ncbi:two-component hybrid sensor and regulator [Labilithrix luteola]|uniref:histidine kinase n=2 Tax=Labilithrix luteola TaxID=1391654 RepID=A0A0K1PM51_9BACT|nr:two-component hybrid sensor and regulator [Labilithrix luteola]
MHSADRRRLSTPELEHTRGQSGHGLATADLAAEGDDEITGRRRVIPGRRREDPVESAQAAHRRSSFLVHASSMLLSMSFDPAETLRKLATMTVPTIADACTVVMTDERTGKLRCVANVWSDPNKDALASSIQERYPAEEDTSVGIGRIIKTGVAELHSVFDGAMVSRMARSPEHFEMLRALGIQSLVIAPLQSRRGVIGALALFSVSEGRRYQTTDLEMAEQLAASAGLAAENARLHQAEQRARATIERTASRMHRLQDIVTDLAAAMTSEDVARAVIQHSLAAFGAAAATIWTLDAATNVMRRRNSSCEHTLDEPRDVVSLDRSTPFTEAVREKRPIFVVSRDDFRRRYPSEPEAAEHLDGFACLPLVVRGEVFGTLVFSFDGRHVSDDDERKFMVLVASYCAQGLYRTHAYEAERRARSEMALLYAFVDAVNRATTITDVYDSALDAIQGALGDVSCAIVLYAEGGLPRFKAWRGISEIFRQTFDGHSAWPREGKDPQPLFVDDVETDPRMAVYLRQLHSENVGAVAFFPLVHNAALLGMLVVGSSVPRRFEDDAGLMQTIAAQIAQAVVRKLSETEAQAARADAEHASRMKDEFLAVVSHELRTPLASITGWANILQTDRKNDPAILAKGLAVIERNAKAQATIIEDILDVSRIIRGNLVLDAKPVSLAPVIVEAIESLKTSATAKEIDVEFDPGDDPFSLVGDAERLRQIAWNLVSNAIKFTPARGKVRVRLRRELTAIVLEVSDSGKGIQRDFLPFVFDRFRQGDSSTTRREGGLGLGLSIVRQLVELHGGQVGVTSDGPGLGTTFHATFPVRAVAAEPPHERLIGEGDPTVGERPSAQSWSDIPDLGDLRVLVVDDQADAREMLTTALEAYGATVAVAGSVHDALGVLRAFEPHVIVTDIGMPDEDGYALLRHVRAMDGSLKSIPAVALTAYARAEDARRCREAGFESHVTKPVRPEHLARAVANTQVSKARAYSAAQLR